MPMSSRCLLCLNRTLTKVGLSAVSLLKRCHGDVWLATADWVFGGDLDITIRIREILVTTARRGQLCRI